MKYLKVEEPDNFYYIDIETDGLSPTLIHCVVIKNKGSRQVWKFKNEDGQSGPQMYHELRKFFEDRKNAVWCAHYGLSFDCPHLAYFTGHNFRIDNWVDTLVLSYLYSPALEGGHSLEEYGERLKFPKVEYSDWSKYTPEMLHRCTVDVDLLELVHDALLKRMNKIGFSELSCEIEHKIRVIIDQQQKNGFWFNQVRANDLLQHLTNREADLSKSIRSLFPPKLEKLGEYTRRFRKDGSNTAQYEKHIQNTDVIIKDLEEGYETYAYKEFNIGSSQQRLKRLLELGYEPTQRTKKGNPRIDEDSLLEYSKICNRPEISAMAEYLVVTGRKKLVGGNPETGAKGLLGWVNPETSRIYGKVLTCGATSRRFRHMDPSLAIIPSPQNGAAYGEECRALFGVTPDLNRLLVGYDINGLEAHVMCHLLNNLRANKLLLEGDVHESNRIALQSALNDFLGPSWGKMERGGGGAKTCLYAAIYGAYPPKLGSIIKQGKGAGEVIQRVLYNNIPGLGKAVQEAQDEWHQSREGFIRCIDGGFVRCPSESAAFNYRIQPNGGILMKLTTILLDQKLKDIGLWHMKVVDVHDEGQHETSIENAEELGKQAVQAITDAGEQLRFKIRMSGSFKIGTDWSKTH